jgi:hypothetical protein
MRGWRANEVEKAKDIFVTRREEKESSREIRASTSTQKSIKRNYKMMKAK